MPQQFDFFRRQFADRSCCEITQPERAFRDSAQPEDGEADITAHAADLSVEALMKREGEDGIASGRGAGRDFNRSRSVSFGEHHAAPHDIKSFLWGISPHKNFISLSLAAARMHKLLGEGAVVGQDEESFGKIIQAADGVEAQPPILLRNKIKDGFASLGIGGSGDHLHGLVQHEIDMLLSVPERFAVHSDRVVGADAHAGFGRGAIDADTSLSDEFVRLAAGTDAGLGNNLIETESFFHSLLPPIPHMVDNGTGSVKASERYGPPLQIFKVYIITIMGHLNIALYPYYICKNLRCLKISWRRCRRSPCGIYYFPLCKDALFFWGAGNFPRHSPQGLHLSPRETVPLAKVLFSIVHPALVRFLLLSPFSFS